MEGKIKAKKSDIGKDENIIIYLDNKQIESINPKYSKRIIIKQGSRLLYCKSWGGCNHGIR